MSRAQRMDAFHHNSADSSSSEGRDQLCEGWGGLGGAAEKHCVPRVCWQMALASVVVIMAALLRAFVWPWGKLNGSIFVSHTAKWWHSQISIPALSRCSNGRKKADPKKIQFQLVLTEKAGVLVKPYTRFWFYCGAMLLYEFANKKKVNWVCFIKTTDFTAQP